MLGGSTPNKVKDVHTSKSLLALHRMNEISNTWVSYNLHGEEKDYWAIEKLTEMAASKPIVAWEILNEINKIVVTDKEWEKHIDSVVGCGPLEEIIALHSKTLLNSILDEAKNSDRLKNQSSMIYETSIDRNIWLKIQNVIKN